MSIIYKNDVCKNVLGNQHRLDGAEMILYSVVILRIFEVKCKI